MSVGFGQFSVQHVISMFNRNIRHIWLILGRCKHHWDTIRMIFQDSKWPTVVRCIPTYPSWLQKDMPRLHTIYYHRYLPATWKPQTYVNTILVVFNIYIYIYVHTHTYIYIYVCSPVLNWTQGGNSHPPSNQHDDPAMSFFGLGDEECPWRVEFSGSSWYQVGQIIPHCGFFLGHTLWWTNIAMENGHL